jgi:hypothetical protein
MKTYSDETGWPCHKSIDNKICDHKTCPDKDCQFKEFLENGSTDLHTKLPTHRVDEEV